MRQEDDPFERLARSHRRLEEQLRELSEAARAVELDAGVVRDVADFLGRQVQRHEEDEEATLLPRLAHVADLADVLRAVRDDHAAHHALHADLESVVRALADAPASAAVRADLARVSAALEEAYRAHIDLEESVLFPAARRAIGDAELAAMSAEMDARRGPGRGRGRRRDQG